MKTNDEGSPPPVWGILDPNFVVVPIVRITPTRVGNTLVVGIIDCLRWDHPHPCGEYGLMENLTINKRGSPPPVWGIP